MGLLLSSEGYAVQTAEDGVQAAQLVVWTSPLSIVTIFLQVCLLMGLGFLPM